MDIVIKLNSEVNGKDKVARLVQYGCRAVYDSLNAKDEAHLLFIHKLKSLEFVLSSFRKRKFSYLSSQCHIYFTTLFCVSVLRLGKSLEVFYGALKTIHLSDAWLAFTLTVNKICSSIFLLTDHIIWLARSGLVKDIETSKWQQMSNKFWVISLVMSIVRDVYEINRVVSSVSSYKNLSTCLASSVVSIRSPKDVSLRFSSLLEFLVTYKHLTVDTVKNCCDIFIPLTGMGYTKLSPRTIGLLGMVSSVAGLIVILNPQCKLTPN